MIEWEEVSSHFVYKYSIQGFNNMSVKKDQKKTTKNTVWTSKRVDSWMKDYAEGVVHKDNPWLDGQIGVRNPNIVFEYTPEEIEELTKCASDIIYFANNFCYCLHGSKGYQPLTLRDYQEEMLRGYQDNRFSITCASRQIGKCFFDGEIEVNGEKKNINDLYTENTKKSFIQRMKVFLYKMYRKL